MKREVEYCYGCLAALGEYQEILGPFFQVRGRQQTGRQAGGST